MIDTKTVVLPDTFSAQLKQALENYAHPAWLGERSPLAMPYFLGEYLWRQPGAQTAVGRGQALQQVLREAAATMAQQDEEGSYAQRVLDLTFFRPQILFDILDTLGIARATYYRHLSKATQRLGETLIRCVNPSLRLEKPALPATLLARPQALAACLPPLQRGQSLALLGSGGAGKTTLAAALADRLAPQRAFWFTLRPGLNDRLGSLLFALGYFLHIQGASSLWLQLVADGGKVNLRIAPGLLRYDLKSLHDRPPLLCFDEIDRLRPLEAKEHTQMLAFLESLRGLAPLIFVGRQQRVATDIAYTLPEFGPSEAAMLLEQMQISLSRSDLARLYNYTGGNPRLLNLFITLHSDDEPLADLIQRAATAPSLEFLLSRIWRCLDEDERRLAGALSVFQCAAPSDAWLPEQPALDRLVARNLALRDAHGGVALLPALRQAVYVRLAPEQRELLHLDAAEARAARGEYTRAAYHYIKGGRPEMAVWIWYERREHEINQGQAAAGLALFDQISHSQLCLEDREALALLRAELRVVVGESARARADLATIDWSDDRLSTLRARQIAGDIMVRQGKLDQALEEYRAGLSSASAMIEGELALLHTRLGRIHERQRDLNHAWREARLARYEADNLQGYLQVELGNYAAAHEYYLQALAIAEDLGYAPGQAKTCDNLGQLLARRAEFEAAARYWDRAFAYYKNIGDLSRLARIKANQAGLYIDLGQPHAAIEPAQEALALYERLGEAHGRAHAAHNLADAHLRTGSLDAAARFADLALREDAAGIRPYSLLTLGEVRLAQGRLDEAEDFCRQAIQAAEASPDNRICAYAWRTLGGVLRAGGRVAAARPAFEKAAELFGDLELHREVAKTQELLQS